MYTDTNSSSENTPHEAQPETNRTFVRNRTEGFVIQCDGMHAVISAEIKKDGTASDDYWSVGMLMSIKVSEDTRTIGMLYKVESDTGTWDNDGDNRANIHVELVGEIKTNSDGKPSFNGGISAYPHLGSIAHRIRRADLAAVFENNDESAVRIGALSQNAEIPALLAVDSMISRHFAVVGTTGVGKSSTVTLLMRKVIEQRPDIRILILDPHNEFSSAFPDKAVVITAANLDLPFWAFRLEEIVEVLFRGRTHIPEEVDILRDAIPKAKAMFKGDDRGSLRRTQSDEVGITADTPIPYRMSDLVRIIDGAMGKLGNSEQMSHLKALLARIQAVTNDPNFRFMFTNTTIEDNLDTVLSTIFRVPAHDRPITAFQLSGIPSEVVNVVVSILCRLAFDLAVWSDSKIKTLVLCEEAHRYIPSNKGDGFAPTRHAIARIAKEGRKYGVSLGIVTQRPGELDETILSQCNTFVAMRLGNDIDQDIMRKAISGASRSYINFLPSLANREAILFGQGVSTPMRMRMMTIPKHELPANHLMDPVETGGDDANTTMDLHGILQNMRFPKNTEPADDLAAITTLSENIVGEQRSSIAAQPEQSNPSLGEQEQGLFRSNTSLRRETDNASANSLLRSGRRETDPVREARPHIAEPSGASGNSLVGRFRRG